ncbi:MAG TPA: hypothetical protein VF144_12270 [Chitinophagaceae bacterium]
MALTIPYLFFGTMAPALNNGKQPEQNKMFLQVTGCMQEKTIKRYSMKKIFTMCLGLVLTAVVFAAERKPDVTIISMKKYEIVIDGKSYFSNDRMMNINNLRNGRHSIRVYEMNNRSFSIFKRKQLVASKTFQLRNNDVRITIDRFGHLVITEDRFGRGDKFGKDKDRDWNDRNGRDRDRRY